MLISDVKDPQNTCVAVGVSGGVDSSVALYLLKKAGFSVFGAMHYIWPDSLCCSVTSLTRARITCENLGVDFYVSDLSKEFRKEIVDNFISVYLDGQTPNPCVLCNGIIRFGAFFKNLEELSLDKNQRDRETPFYFSTGHYVRTTIIDGKTFILRGKDPKKDQSYMLYRVKSEILACMIFPLGELTKPQTIDIAKSNHLPTSSIKDSQDACFVDGDYADFIRKDTGNQKLNLTGFIIGPDGNHLGKHRGFIHYTRGQRKGLGLGNGPWYVDRVEPETNTVYVCREDSLLTGEFFVNKTNWFINVPMVQIEAEVSLRYQAACIDCRIEPVADDIFRVRLKTLSPITPGQSAVFYRGDLVIGGGIIS